MSQKLHELATCPYCKNTALHTFYFNASSLFCCECDKEFAIKLKTQVVVNSAKFYDKQCCACNKYLHSDNIKDNTCPNCGYNILEDVESEFSEFNII